jgi:hypothetical protein
MSVSPSTAVVCTGATISTTQFAYLRIEVRSTTDVRFFVDPDVSNGITEIECGSGSASNIPTVGLAGMLMHSAATGGTATMNLDVDYYRVWQQ